MVSEAVKQRKAAKKQAAASRNTTRPAASRSSSSVADDDDAETEAGGDGDGEQQQQQQQQRDGGAAAAAAAAGGSTGEDGEGPLSPLSPSPSVTGLAGLSLSAKERRSAANSAAASGASTPVTPAQLKAMKAAARSSTGVLSSHPRGMDVHITNFSLTFYGVELFKDTTLELNHGRRYGLIGYNGCGKSALLECLAAREVPIPSHIDIFLLTAEMEASDKTALESVMEVDDEVARLEAEAESLMHAEPSDEVNDRLTSLYERLEELDAALAEVRAARILHGLGFTKAMQQKKIRDFSGGWRMRVALARALFLKPALLLLDEPTNHLDLEACVWLEAELAKYNSILLLISHSQDFLNGVCTNIMHIHNGSFKVYSGNYDAYVRTRMELEENQQKRFEWEQAQVSHMKDYIARFGHGSAKLARQAKSKEKLLNKVLASGLTEKVSKERFLTFRFPECGTLPPPVLMVQNISFRYSPDTDWIYHDLDFGIDLDSRIALVGPNGAGKSTLLKLLDGSLAPTTGMVRHHSHLRIGRYSQHLADQLDENMAPLEYMMHCFPDKKGEEDMRRAVGRFGITGKEQVTPIRNLSDGQKSRVVFAWLAFTAPQLLLLDEPTNHLDLETIDALAEAINEFEGGLVLVSHDFRLISQVAEEIWVCDKKKVTKWEGDILTYKDTLRKHIAD